jgi:hypothetical protein
MRACMRVRCRVCSHYLILFRSFFLFRRVFHHSQAEADAASLAQHSTRPNIFKKRGHSISATAASGSASGADSVAPTRERVAELSATAAQARQAATAAAVAADQAEQALREAEAAPAVTEVAEAARWKAVTDAESGDTYYWDKVWGDSEIGDRE